MAGASSGTTWVLCSVNASILKHRLLSLYLMLSMLCGRHCYHSYFIDKETETQRDELACLNPSREELEAELTSV